MLGVLRPRPYPDAVRRGRPSRGGLRRCAGAGGEGATMSALRLHRELAAIWATGPGLQRLAAVNHSVIGLRFMATAFVFFSVAAVLPLLTPVQPPTPPS